MATSHPAPTPEQITRCGAIWDRASRQQCEAFLTCVGGYRADVVADFALYRWEQMGHAVQADLARVMLALHALLRTAV